jgi:hexosaminidase
MELAAMKKILFLILLCALMLLSLPASAAEVWLDSLDLSHILTGWGEVGHNRSVSGGELNIGGVVYERGLGVHAQSCIRIGLDGQAQRLRALAGVDQAMRGRGSVDFVVLGDGEILWRSGVMRGGMSAREIDLPLGAVQVLELLALDGGDGIGQDHANWAMAWIVSAGDRPSLLPVARVPLLPRPLSPTNRSEARAHLIPYPRECAWGEGSLALAEFRLSVPADLAESLRVALADLARDILAAGGRSANSTSAVPIRLELAAVDVAGIEEGAYRLSVTSQGVGLRAADRAGLFNGIQTLRQLVQTEQNGEAFLPECEILDWPAFAWRGFMHDVGRNFQDIELLKKFVDVLAQYKYNIFHFHLTDYPGYRIESRKYPELNKPENYRQTRRPGEYYTFDQLNDFIAYCAERNIQVIPEIDVPGHSTYFEDAFGFDMQDPRGLKIVLALFEEFMDNIDVPVMHIGSDEVSIRNPEFMPAVLKALRARDKDVIVWRPGHLPDRGVITQLWTGQAQPVSGVRMIDSRANYINHMDALVGPVRAFMQQHCDVPQGDDLALGAILCHWPDSNVGEQMNIYRQSPVLPAMLAFAERVWRGALNNRADAWARLPSPHDPVFREYAEFERDMLAHGKGLGAEWPFPYARQTHIPWRLIGPFDHGGDTGRAFPVESGIADSYEVDGRVYRWSEDEHIGGTIHINHFFGFPAHLPKSNPGTVYGLTYVKSPREQEVDFWIGFNGQSRSGIRASGPNPQQGQWSVVDSQVWLNGDPIAPPVWEQPGLAVKTSEIPMVDENYYFREPSKLRLNKGWNTVLIKAPHGAPARKWMFTFAPAPGDGEDLQFSGQWGQSIFPHSILNSVF